MNENQSLKRDVDFGLFVIYIITERITQAQNSRSSSSNQRDKLINACISSLKKY